MKPKIHVRIANYDHKIHADEYKRAKTPLDESVAMIRYYRWRINNGGGDRSVYDSLSRHESIFNAEWRKIKTKLENSPKLQDGGGHSFIL